MKVCTQCKKEKENLDFPKRKTNKDGLYSWCKECCIKKTKIHKALNPELVKSTREKRREKALEQARKYKEKNKEKLAKKQKEYYVLNAEKLKEKAREYAKKPKTEKQKAKRREYYEKWKQTETGKNYVKNTWKEKKRKYNKIYKAGQKVQDALKSAKLTRPEKCLLCPSTKNIQAHHPDYDKPLEVVWVCVKCHKMIHKGLKEG